MTIRTGLVAALLAASTLAGVPALAQDNPAPAASLEDKFRDPPQSARPRVWWHWMNGNVSKDGIARDMAWMKAVGIGGLQNFDANLQTSQIVDRRLVYMAPEWKDAFRFAASEADRLGLELAIAASPGWSENGGGRVKPEQGMKKPVWSMVHVAPGARAGALPMRTGPFQDLAPQLSIEEINSGKPQPEAARYGGVVRVPAFPVPAELAGRGVRWRRLGPRSDLPFGC